MNLLYVSILVDYLPRSKVVETELHLPVARHFTPESPKPQLADNSSFSRTTILSARGFHVSPALVFEVAVGL